jgi:glycosyltransferase involved in cell wall biosynthesis
VRQFELLGVARRHHEVTVIVEEYGAGTPADRRELKRRWPEVRIIPAAGSPVDGTTLAADEATPQPWRRGLRRLRERIDPGRSVVRGYRYPSTLEAVRTVIDEGVDLIEVEYVQMFRYLPAEPRCPVLLVALDVLGRRDKRARQTVGADRHVVLGDGRARRHEVSALRKADVVVVTSQEDAGAARDAGAGDVRVVPNGAADGYLAMPLESSPRRLLFVGWAGHSPNRDALDWWLREIVPHLEDDAVLDVVGGGWQDFEPRARLRTHGYVEDLQPLLSGSVVVAPLRVGGGTKIKMLEAMAAGRPIVATSIAAEGLPIRDGIECLVRDTPDAFAAAVNEIRHNPDLGMRLGEAARDAARPLAWSAIAERMMELYADLVTSDSPRRTGPTEGAP